MRKWIPIGAALLAFSASALAADLPAKVYTAPPKPAVWDWTGFYVGGDIGYGWGTSDSSVTFGKTTLTGDTSPTGWVYGGHFGAQKQYGSIVLGAQGTILGGSLKDTVNVSGLPKGFPVVTKADKFNFIALGEAKLGYAIAPGWLPYISGGVAAAQSNTTLAMAGGGSVTSSKTDNVGWTIGAGLDYAMTANWILGIKYNYIDLGTAHTSFALGGSGAGIDIPNTQKINAVEGEITYKFGSY